MENAASCLTGISDFKSLCNTICQPPSGAKLGVCGRWSVSGYATYRPLELTSRKFQQRAMSHCG